MSLEKLWCWCIISVFDVKSRRTRETYHGVCVCVTVLKLIQLSVCVYCSPEPEKPDVGESLMAFETPFRVSGLISKYVLPGSRLSSAKVINDLKLGEMEVCGCVCSETESGRN